MPGNFNLRSTLDLIIGNIIEIIDCDQNPKFAIEKGSAEVTLV